ncbi:MAG: hypothetical protein Q7S28_02915 [bacterium]|nr:hypothetical protein [bacterium]
MNNKILIVAGVALLVLAAFFLLSGGVLGGVIGDGITLYRSAYMGQPTEQGFVYIPFTQTSDNFDLANVAIDMNGDGTYAAYDVNGKKQEEWLVKNMPAELIAGEANRYVLRIVDPAFGTKPVKGVAVLTKNALAGDVWPAAEIEKAGPPKKEFNITEVIIEDRAALRANDPSGLRTGLPIPGSFLEKAFAQAPAPAVPQNYGVKVTDAPDQDQLYNECGPTAISNGFRWLAKKYKVEDRMPPGDTRDLIDELKGDLQWSDGVWDNDILNGKNNFIKRHNLPFEAHLIGHKNDMNFVDKIYDELEKGQAVELTMSFYNASGSPSGGHVVTVVGAGVKDGRAYLTFHDPDTSSANGRPSRDVYHVDGGTDMLDYWPGNLTVIDYAYAQSPLATFTAGTWIDPQKDAGVFVTGQTLTAPGEDLTLNRSQFGFFSVAVDDPGDHYVGDTFTVRAGAHATNKERTVSYRDASGAAKSWTHGAGKPWTLEGSFEGNGVTPAKITDAPPMTSVNGDRFTIDKQMTCTSPGTATVSFRAKIAWPGTGGEPPAEVQRIHHGAEFDSKSDEMLVTSPPFRCIAKPGAKKNDSRTALQPFCPGVTEDPSGQAIDVLKAGTECYPTLQFHQAQKDKCDATHWHANAGTAVSLKGSTWVDPSGCGFGRITEVTAGIVHLSQDEAAKFIGGQF